MKRGVTLVEILVVVAILAVLAALLFPAFQSVRGRAAVSSDVEKMRQLGASVQLYSADYDDLLVPGLNGQSWVIYASAPADFPVKNRPVGTFADLILPRAKEPDLCQRTRVSKEVRTGLAPHLDCAFLYDEWAGVREKRWSEIAPETSLLRPDYGSGTKPKTPGPCLQYSGAVKTMPVGECEGGTTWWHD